MADVAQMAVDRWNDLYPIGTEIEFWPGAREGEGRLAITTTPAWLLGGHTPVVTCGAYPGGIALTHVEPISPPAGDRGAERVMAAENGVTVVGRCGEQSPTVLPHPVPSVCRLPWGHKGWHLADDGCEWGRTSTYPPAGDHGGEQ